MSAAGYERLVFDPLEPRLLLNADVLTVNLAQQGAAAPVDHSLIVQMVQATEQVNNQAVTVQRVQVVDQSDNNAILAFGDLNEISATLDRDRQRQQHDHHRRHVVRRPEGAGDFD